MTYPIKVMDYAAEPIVIDNGSKYIKAGFGGDDLSCIIYNLIGRLRWSSNESNEGPCFVGDELVSKSPILKCTYAVWQGEIIDWDGMNQIWSYIFKTKLNALWNEHPVMLTQANSTPEKQKLLACKTMFENFNVPAFYLQNDGVLPLYDAGRTTGVSVNLGHSLSNVTAVWENTHNSSCQIEFGSNDIDSNLFDSLRKHSFTEGRNLEINQTIASQIFENAWYISENYIRDINKCPEDVSTSYNLPDGSSLDLSYFPFKCPEAFFKPDLLNNYSFKGIHNVANDCIQSCISDFQEDLYSNIVLWGGSSMLPGFDERLYEEVKALAPESARVTIRPSQDKMCAVWNGASILSTLSSFADKWITKEDFKEFGENIVLRKCI